MIYPILILIGAAFGVALLVGAFLDGYFLDEKVREARRVPFDRRTKESIRMHEQGRGGI